MDVSLSANIGALARSTKGLCERLDREHAFRQRALQATRQIPFVINLPIAGGAGSLNPVPATGPDVGYFWSIRRLSATGFSAGTVIISIDSTAGEPIQTFTGATIGTYVQTFGKGHQMVHPNSNLAISAAGITGTVIVYGSADQFESWLLPFYMGSIRG
jgi:hypothetical protein